MHLTEFDSSGVNDNLELPDLSEEVFDVFIEDNDLDDTPPGFIYEYNTDESLVFPAQDGTGSDDNSGPLPDNVAVNMTNEESSEMGTGSLCDDNSIPQSNITENHLETMDDGGTSDNLSSEELSETMEYVEYDPEIHGLNLPQIHIFTNEELTNAQPSGPPPVDELGDEVLMLYYPEMDQGEKLDHDPIALSDDENSIAEKKLNERESNEVEPRVLYFLEIYKCQKIIPSPTALSHERRANTLKETDENRVADVIIESEASIKDTELENTVVHYLKNKSLLPFLKRNIYSWLKKNKKYDHYRSIYANSSPNSTDGLIPNLSKTFIFKHSFREKSRKVHLTVAKQKNTKFGKWLSTWADKNVTQDQMQSYENWMFSGSVSKMSVLSFMSVNNPPYHPYRLFKSC